MWIIHSLNPERDLKDGDLRRQLIEHAYDPNHLMLTPEKTEKKVRSSFERELMKHLEGRGYQVTPQWQVGAYRIDLVVEGNGKRLAIECDGDPYHTFDMDKLSSKLSEDMERQAILERLGWIFTRVRATEFFRDAERALRPVFERLDVLEIPPVSDTTRQPRPADISDRTGSMDTTESLVLTGADTGAENEEPQPIEPADLVARVIHRAGELREKWALR